MSDRAAPAVSDGEPFIGDVVAVVDESARPAGAGMYYVLVAAATFDPDAATVAARAVIGKRRNPFHWIKEGPKARAAMIDVMLDTCVSATVKWQSTSRTGQLRTRGKLLDEIATWAHTEGVSHLVIEASDETINQRDRGVLGHRALQLDGHLGFQYDHRSKHEPIVWMADALAGAVSEHLLNVSSEFYDKLAVAGLMTL